jgi:hypothetical protein
VERAPTSGPDCWPRSRGLGAAGASVAGADVSPGAVVAVVESDELSEEQAATITAASTHDDSTRTALRKSDLGIASPCRSTTLWSPDEGTSGDP